MPRGFYGHGLPGIDPSALQGALIVVEGADGSGRSTQITMLRDALERSGHATVDVGLKRSRLVGRELDDAMKGNILSPRTLALFYATDFADQLENRIVPALKAGFTVLADRYIYTLMARALVRGAEPEWIQDVYGIALVPDAVFYLGVNPKLLAERNFRKNSVLDYWEAGMDIRRTGDLYQNFIHYQREIQKQFRAMEAVYEFERINGNRAPRTIFRNLLAKIEELLEPRAG
jgi:dTMP kinase